MNHPMPHLPAPRLHPALLAAALSVSAFSLAGIGVMTGTFPSSSASPTPAATIAATAPAAAPVVAPVAVPAARSTAPQHAASRPAAKMVDMRERPQDEVSRHDGADIEVGTGNAGRPYKTAAPAICYECGVVESVREVKVDGEGTGLGAVGGAVLGGLIGSNIGGGRGNDLAKIVGVVGGGYAGHQIEKNARSQMRYEVVVRFEDGTSQTLTQTTAPSWRQGDRVRLSNGTLVSGV